jgi:hypothetical protein
MLPSKIIFAILDAVGLLAFLISVVVILAASFAGYKPADLFRVIIGYAIVWIITHGFVWLRGQL